MDFLDMLFSKHHFFFIYFLEECFFLSFCMFYNIYNMWLIDCCTVVYVIVYAHFRSTFISSRLEPSSALFLIKGNYFFVLKLKAMLSWVNPLGSCTVTFPLWHVYFTCFPFWSSVIFPVGSLPSHSMVVGSSFSSGSA